MFLVLRDVSWLVRTRRDVSRLILVRGDVSLVVLYQFRERGRWYGVLSVLSVICPRARLVYLYIHVL
jgi:hypothetical protein